MITGGPCYTTLQACRRQLVNNDNDQTFDDDWLADLIVTCSQGIEDACGYNFDVRIETHDFNGEVGLANPTLFLQAWPLLSVTAITNGDGSSVSTSNIDLLPRSLYPKTDIRLKYASGLQWVTPSGGPITYLDSAFAVDVLSVTGEYGFNRFYPRAWVKTPLTVSGSMTDTTTSLAINTEPMGVLDVGMQIKIGSEWMLVTGPVTDTAVSTTLIVVRGYNGSTAAAHSNGDAIYMWRVEPVIEEATRMLVAAHYFGRNNPGGQVMTAMGATVSTTDFPDKIREKLAADYANPFRGNL